MFQLIWFLSSIIQVLPTYRKNLRPVSRTGHQASRSKLNFELFRCLVWNLALPPKHSTLFRSSAFVPFLTYFSTYKSTEACQKILIVQSRVRLHNHPLALWGRGLGTESICVCEEAGGGRGGWGGEGGVGWCWNVLQKRQSPDFLTL